MFRLAIVVASISGILALPQLRSVPSLDGRIVGGEDADIQDYPYQLSLQFLGSHICGAATISSTWALTAAHCLDGLYVISLFTIRAGSTTHNSGGQVVSVLQATVHTNYSPYASTIDYDIAALLLASPLTVSNAVPIALPLPGSGPSAGSTAILTGWGYLQEKGSLSTVLQVVQVPVVSREDCAAAYPNQTSNRMFCAGFLETGGKDACQGDSGGPVIVDKVLTGVVSWGTGCARPGKPGVYTNIAVLREWVNNITGL